MNNPKDKPERRRHPRIARNFILKFRPQNSESPKWEVPTLKNISQGGCYFYSSIPCEVGQLLEIEIQFPVFPEPMHFVGEVKRVDSQKVAQMTSCGVGVYFREVEEEKKQKFLEILEFSLKHK